jgi:hypothetical protein
MDPTPINPDRLDVSPHDAAIDPDHLPSASTRGLVDPDKLHVSPYQRDIDPDKLHVGLDQASDETPPKRSLTKRFNDKAADWTAAILSSMWMFWLLAIIFVIAVRLQAPKGADEMIMFYMAGAFAAIALPVLAFVNNIAGDRQEALMRKMQGEMLEELRILKQVAASRGASGTTDTNPEV